MSQQNDVNSEVKTKTLYRSIAYTAWIIFFVLLVLWALNAISSDRVWYCQGILAVIGVVFTLLMANKKIPGESESPESGPS